MCIDQVEKLHTLYAHPKREQWFEKRTQFRMGRGEVHGIPCSVYRQAYYCIKTVIEITS